jgi:Domain of unknown function (DUF4365)
MMLVYQIRVPLPDRERQKMRPLESRDIESELSYAYLHAVASHAGMSCKWGTRHDDNRGIDAQLVGWGPFENGGYLREVSLHVQLKATVRSPADDGTHLSYFLQGTAQYDDLRANDYAIPRFLMVLFLPENSAHWLNHTPEQLAIKNCAYWVSLAGAPSTENVSGATVKIPKSQVLHAQELRAICARLSRRDIPQYSGAA